MWWSSEFTYRTRLPTCVTFSLSNADLPVQGFTPPGSVPGDTYGIMSCPDGGAVRGVAAQVDTRAIWLDRSGITSVRILCTSPSNVDSTLTLTPEFPSSYAAWWVCFGGVLHLCSSSRLWVYF